METEVSKFIEAARGVLKISGYFVDKLWHVHDVDLICEQLELPKVTAEEAMEVFTLADEQFDGEAGISWPQLEKALRAYLKRKEILSGLYKNNSQ